MADDLLALTRPGAMPTLRATDTPTIAPESAPTIAGRAPTIASAATAVSPGTLPPAIPGSATQPASAAPPLAATILTPGTATAAGAASPAAPVRPAPARAARPTKTGSGLGLVVGLAAVGVLFLLVVAGGGWWFLKQRQPVEPGAVTSTPVAELTPPAVAATPAADAGSSLPAESAATSAPTTAPATPVPAATVAPRAATIAQPPGAQRVAVNNPGDAARPSGGEARAASQPPAASGDFGFLNDVPQQGPDGREVGAALAEAYRAGGSSGITNRRFSARPRVPRDVAPIERPAVATLLHIMFVQQAYQRQNGRYGNLNDLKTAGLLHLDVPFANGDSSSAASTGST